MLLLLFCHSCRAHELAALSYQNLLVDRVTGGLLRLARSRVQGARVEGDGVAHVLVQCGQPVRVVCCG